MRKNIITIIAATLITVGVVYGASFLSPGGSSTYLTYSYVSAANSTTTLNGGGPGLFYALTLDSGKHPFYEVVMQLHLNTHPAR